MKNLEYRCMRKKKLTEAEKKSKLLVEQTDFLAKGELVEVEGQQPKWIISGPFAKADYPTLNNTVYPKEVLNSAITNLRKKVQEGRVKILLDHPEGGLFGCGAPRMKDAAALMTEITDVDDIGMCHYKAQILDNANGDIVKSILKAGGAVGVSTRGYGSTKESEYPPHAGKFRIIQNDYEMETIDFVDGPAVPDSEKFMKYENTQRRENMTLEELKKEYPELLNSFEKEIKESFEKEIMPLKSLVEAVTAKIKETKPELFQVIPESELVSKKEVELTEAKSKIEASIKESTSKIEALTKELSEAKDKISQHESEKIKLEMEKEIESLKATDPDFFKLKSISESLNSCVNSAEVKQVYEAKKKLLDEIKKEQAEQSQVATPKTESTKTPDSLTPEQKIKFEAQNIQRKVLNLKPLTEQEFLNS